MGAVTASIPTTPANRPDMSSLVNRLRDRSVGLLVQTTSVAPAALSVPKAAVTPGNAWVSSAI
ncbi:hypothetical protein D3C72_1771320 [compost metagenome]